MKKSMLVFVLILLFSIGCAKPLPRDITARVDNKELIIMHQSPDNDHWYNKKAGRLVFNEKETKYLKDVLGVLKEKW